MKILDFYTAGIEVGMRNDPRGYNFVLDGLEKQKKKFEKLSDKEKESIDKESLSNPYKDSRILFTPALDLDIKNIAVGIDVETPELLLVDKLRNMFDIDMVLTHHPEGFAYANFYQVMNMQSDILAGAGVPINIAESTLEKRITEVSRKILPANHFRATDSARLLEIPYMSMHTPADNCVTTFLINEFENKKPRYLEEIIEILESIPEYKMAKQNGIGPRILIGKKERKCGKIYVDMTGGTEGSKDIFEAMAFSGIGTIVCMHLSEEHFKNAEKANINVIVAGHISSDTFGLNLLLDQVEKKTGSLKYINISGFIRIPR